MDNRIVNGDGALLEALRRFLAGGENISSVVQPEDKTRADRSKCSSNGPKSKSDGIDRLATAGQTEGLEYCMEADTEKKRFCDQFLENVVDYKKSQLMFPISKEAELQSLNNSSNIPSSPTAIVPSGSAFIKSELFCGDELLFDGDFFETTLKDLSGDNSNIDDIESTLLGDEKFWAESFSEKLFATI